MADKKLLSINEINIQRLELLDMKLTDTTPDLIYFEPVKMEELSIDGLDIELLPICKPKVSNVSPYFKRGVDGLTLYTWIKFASSPTEGMSDNPVGKSFLGIAVNKLDLIESLSYSDYQWIKIGGGGNSINEYRLDFWHDYTPDKFKWVLSAGLGYSLYKLLGSVGLNFLRKDVPDTANEPITFAKGLSSKGVADLEKGFKTGDYGVNELGEAVLKKATSIEEADLQKGFKTGSWGLNEQGEFGAKKVTSSQAVLGDVTLTGAMRSTTFHPGMFGEGFFFGRTGDGKTYIECDNAYFRGTMTVDELVIHRTTHVGGATMYSPAGGEIESVQNMDSYWKVELKDKDNIFFKQYDQILCQNFSENKKKRYWRLCTSVDYDNGFIHLSKTDCEALSAEPETGDEIVTFGNRNDTARQNAVYISSYGQFGAFQQFFSGVDSYDLTGKIDIQFGREIDITADKLEIRGRDGKKTRVPRERGEYVSGETYYYYDRVRHNGAFWLCMMQQTTAAPSDKSPEWVKETNVRVGGVNLLREYAIQFDFKYWGGHTAQENVNFIMVDIDVIKANVKYMNVSPSLISWVFPEYEALISVRSNVEWTNF